MITREEEILRNAFGSLVPEAPPTIGDATPIVRRARKRRTQLIAAAGVAALAIAAGVAVPLLADDGDGADQLAVGQDRDPWVDVPCAQAPAQAAGFDPDKVVAARLCDLVPVPDFHVAAPPLDALVTGVGGWVDDLDALDAADPGRCAAVDVSTSPMRLVVEYVDGSMRTVDATQCGDVDLGGTTVDAGEVTTAFLDALGSQRAKLGPPKNMSVKTNCKAAGTIAVPTEELPPPLAAAQCPVPGNGPVRQVDAARLAMLADAFDKGTRGGDADLCGTADVGWTMVTVDEFGDVMHWAPSECGATLVMVGGNRTSELVWAVPLDFADEVDDGN